MNSTLKNILGVLAGAIGGSIVNMAIIQVSGSIIPPPEGVDVNNMDSLKTSMHLFEPRHFIFPFLAHALGTFAGAFLAAKIAATYKMRFAMVIGVLFLAGGITAVYMIPAPTWYSALDLAVAYLPMAYIAGKIASR